MRLFAKPVHSLGISKRRRFIGATLLAVGLLSTAALGQIDVNETGLHDDESIYGIEYLEFSPPLVNNQIITLLGWGANESDPNTYENTAFYAYGIYSFTSLSNLAAIDVNAVGGNALSIEGGASASVRAYGIFAETEGSVDVNNTASITVAALGGTAQSSIGGSPDAVALAYGIFADGNVTNNAAIDVTATGGTAETAGNYNLVGAYAVIYGIQADGYVLNSGDITAAATGGTATSAVGLPDNSGTQAYAQAFGIQATMGVENSGDIAVLATGGTAESGDTVNADAQAYGIYNAFGEVNNAGDITVTATAGTAISEVAVANAAAYGIRTESDVVNSGDITVTAQTDPEGEPSEAYGIYMAGGEGNANLTNTGTIRAFGDTAFELVVDGGEVTLVDAYNVTLDGNPETPSILINNGGILNLNNATLTVTDVQGDVEGATQWDTEYQLFTAGNEGMVQGNFGAVDAVNPDVTANYDTQSTPNALDDTVSLSYAPEAAETLASSAVEKRLVAMSPYALNQHMTMDLLYDTLALDEVEEGADDDSTGDTAQGLTACQRSGGAFFQPNYSYIERDNDPLGYEAAMSGVSGGYTQCVNSSLLGLHVGYSRANIDYTGLGYSSNTEDQDIVTGGFSGMTRFRPWIFRYGFTGFHGWHDYHGLTGLGLTETESAEFDSYGGTGLLMVGRTFKHSKHVFLPEIGANWLWVHRESYTTEATDAAWDTTYSTLNDHDVWAQAALHWQSLYRYKKLQITPSASIGIHQLLTDGETEVYQSVPGAARVLVEDEMDETAVSLATAVVVRARHTALTFAYDGEYSSDIEQHNFWMKFKLRF